LGLIFGGFYVKNNPEKEPFASKILRKDLLLLVVFGLF